MSVVALATAVQTGCVANPQIDPNNEAGSHSRFIGGDSLLPHKYHRVYKRTVDFFKLPIRLLMVLVIRNLR